MDEGTTDQRNPTYEDLAGLIGYTLIRPDLTEEDVARGCQAAKQYGVAAVIVRPSDVDAVARWVANTPVRLASIVDVPHGYSCTSAKIYAARDLLRRGAREIETVMNTGKLLSRQFQYLETELFQMAEACQQSNALLKIFLESEYLTEELKIVACRVAKRAGAEFLAPSEAADLPLLRSHARDRLKLETSLTDASPEAALALRDAGCARVRTSDPAPLLEAWKTRLNAA
jgi:deoxyribose-phosphate aldolase